MEIEIATPGDDLSFLKEMQQRLEEYREDPMGDQLSYVEEMIQHWIDELEMKATHLDHELGISED